MNKNEYQKIDDLITTDSDEKKSSEEITFEKESHINPFKIDKKKFFLTLEKRSSDPFAFEPKHKNVPNTERSILTQSGPNAKQFLTPTIPRKTVVNETRSITQSLDFKSFKQETKKEPVKYFWNEQFQSAYEFLFKTENIPQQEILNKQEIMSAIETEFINTSKRIGEVIIDEIYLPLEQKTIKPSQVGGIIGKKIFFNNKL